MPECKIHNVGFYRPEARAIYCMAMEPESGKLALARSDAWIEIWNLNHTPFIEKTIPATLDNFTVEGLCWSEGRLYSTGLHGWLVHYDLYALIPKNKWAVTGEAGTCLDSHSYHVAVGTEQGYINIFSTTSETAEFEKFLDKQEGRIVCLKYCKRGEFVVGGSINALRIWNVQTGHALHRMVLGRAQANKDTVVWCLEVMSDLKVFTGDSRGVLTLWDGKLGAQIESYQSHQADITSICLDDKEESIYLAGVDPIISTYQKIKVGGNTKWVKSIQRKIHDHDVRAMAWHQGRLYSGGIDSYLVCSYHPPKSLVKFAPALQAPCCETTLGDQDRKVLLRYTKRIEVWSLSKAKPHSNGHLGPVEPQAMPRKLVTIQKLGKNWQGEEESEPVTCAAISANGRWIFMATCDRFNLYNLRVVEDRPKLDKVEDLDDSNAHCLRAAFNNKRDQLVTVLGTGKLIVYDLENGDPFIFQRINLKESNALEDSVTLMTISDCGGQMALADCKSNVAVFKHDKDGYTLRARLPRFATSPTALALGPERTVLVTYSNSKVYEYDLEQHKSTGLSVALEECGTWKGRLHACATVTFDSCNNVFLHDDSNVIVIKRSSKTVDSKARKNNKNAKLTNGELGPKVDVCLIPKYKHLVHVSKLSQNEFVVVEANPLAILEQLPPAFAQKTFGSK